MGDGLFFLHVVRSLVFNGQEIKGFATKGKMSDNQLELNWTAQSEPITSGDMHSKTSAAAIFHLFNFPDFRGGQYQAIAAPATCKLMVLESEEWRISVQSLPNGATAKAWERIKDEGGCFLTHVMRIERKDGELFTGEDVKEQCFLLAKFLSFAKGGKCWPVCGVGIDATGKETWRTFASPCISNPVYSWFDPDKTNELECLFPRFVQRWQQSEEWQVCLRAAVYWYVQANCAGKNDLNIDSGIILAQCALERMAYHYLVVDREIISAKAFDDLRASDRLRKLFSACGIPNEITDTTPNIRSANDTFDKNDKWEDAPHAITDIRNSLIHPVSKKKVHDCYMDVWKLSLRYLELSVLALCGYSNNVCLSVDGRVRE